MRRPCPLPLGLETRPPDRCADPLGLPGRVHLWCFKGSFVLILIIARGWYPPGVPSQTQVISRSLPYESHHLSSDGAFEDWLEPSEQWGCIIRCGKRFITGDVKYIRDVSSANIQKSSHGHASGVRDATDVAEPCSTIWSCRPVASTRREG